MPTNTIPTQVGMRILAASDAFNDGVMTDAKLAELEAAIALLPSACDPVTAGKAADVISMLLGDLTIGVRARRLKPTAEQTLKLVDMARAAGVISEAGNAAAKAAKQAKKSQRH